MNFFVTPGQRRILKAYWAKQEPFSLEELISNKLVHCPVLGKICLWRMKEKGQILPQSAKTYMGTTDSAEEWDSLKKEKERTKFYACSGLGLKLEGLNKYELEETTQWMREIIENKKAEIYRRQAERGDTTPSEDHSAEQE